MDERERGVAFVMELATALHRYGTPTNRLELVMARVADRLGLETQFFTTPTSIMAGFGPLHAQTTGLVRVQPGDVDLGKLEALDGIVSAVGDGALDAAVGLERIREVVAAPPRYRAPIRVAASGLVSLCIARFLGGGLAEMAVAAVIGLVVGALELATSRSGRGAHVLDLVGAFVAAALAHGAARAGLDVSVRVTTLAGVIALVPGFTMTVAMNEVANRHLVAGTARLMAAAVVFLEITIGIALADKLDVRLFGAVVEGGGAAALPPWTQPALLPLVALGLMVDLRATPRQLATIVVAAAVAFYASRLGAKGLDPQLGAVVGSFVLAVGANLYARAARRPAMVPLVPGLLMLVPGSLGLGSLTSLVARDVVSGIDAAFSVAIIAVSLVAGLLLANTIAPARREL